MIEGSYSQCFVIPIYSCLEFTHCLSLFFCTFIFHSHTAMFTLSSSFFLLFFYFLILFFSYFVGVCFSFFTIYRYRVPSILLMLYMSCSVSFFLPLLYICSVFFRSVMLYLISPITVIVCFFLFFCSFFIKLIL